MGSRIKTSRAYTAETVATIKMYQYHVLAVLLCAFSGYTSATLPDYIKVCKRDQSTINACVLENIEHLRPYLARGIPELHVPSIEPFYIPELIAISGELASLHASGKNLKVSGLSNYTVKSLDVDLDKITIRAKVRFPKLHFDGLYNIDTQILVVPIKGEGALTAHASKCEADVVIKSKIDNRNGADYLRFTKADISVAVKDYMIRLDGLFNGDKALGDATNEVINQNKQDFLKATLPYLEKTVAKLVLDLANKIMESTPYSELLPVP
ncbi:protein takeout-like [Aricia agestis]|uniref:protein takeout-like n=1 Tax=Aricia agestis TaxID=91739 RepID=UPI001C209B8F|nr:protein takeout-like [Aricia agestis]